MARGARLGGRDSSRGHMTGQLRKDEEFVIDAISRAFSGTWRSGEDPPDVYLMMDNRDIAVEISILMQSRFDGRGGTVSLLSDAMTPMRLADELNDDLKSEIPDGRGVILIKWPFSNMRFLKFSVQQRPNHRSVAQTLDTETAIGVPLMHDSITP
jgi:hypothetical protein